MSDEHGGNLMFLLVALSGASFLETPLTALLGFRVQHDPCDVFWRVWDRVGEFKWRATDGAFAVRFFPYCL
ncbi:MAG: hypothetical protein OXF50_06720 [Caldilineaceae bacterium]|nr:hypothetical protein [Caldilineaceae bacterium]